MATASYNSLGAADHPREPGQDGRVESVALAAVQASGLAHDVLRHGPVRDLAQAAQARGVEPADVVKTMVVRRGEAA